MSDSGETKTSDRERVRQKVLEGADDVTRRKMDAMLEHSSVVELMAKAQARDEVADAQPIKPDFLDTEQYQLARKAIGARGEAPYPSRTAAAAEQERARWGFYLAIVAVLLLALVIVWPLLAPPRGETSPTTPTAVAPTTAPNPTVAPTSAPTMAPTPTTAPPSPTTAPVPETTDSAAPPPVPPPSVPNPSPTGPRFPVQGQD